MVVSGSGHIAQLQCEKIIARGGPRVTLSHSDGCIHDPQGITQEQLFGSKRSTTSGEAGSAPMPSTLAVLGSRRSLGACPAFRLPCRYPVRARRIPRPPARAARLSARMRRGPHAPHPTAMHVLHQARIACGPGKAANAAGLAVSGLELRQHSMRLSWSRQAGAHKLRAAHAPYP